MMACFDGASIPTGDAQDLLQPCCLRCARAARVCIAKRERTDSPLQALILLNGVHTSRRPGSG